MDRGRRLRAAPRNGSHPTDRNETMKHTISSLFIGAITAIALAACTSASGTERSLPLPEKNLALWTMPLDQFVYTTDFALASDYAENLLVSPCMENAGFTFPVPWLNLEALHGPSFNDAGARLFTRELAEQYGYHVAPNPDPGAAEWREIIASSPKMSDEEFATFTRCLTAARKQVHLLPQWAQAASSYANDAMARARQEGSVSAAGRKWRDCMRPLGVSDLPDSPLDMPSQSLAQRFGMNQDGGDPTITDKEIQVAVADMKCQESSGYRHALYDATWQHQVETLNANSDDLKRSFDAIRRHRAEVAAVIAENARTS